MYLLQMATQAKQKWDYSTFKDDQVMKWLHFKDLCKVMVSDKASGFSP